VVRLPGSTDSLTLAEDGMRNSDIPAGLVESPVLSNGHAGFGRRAEETDQSKDRHRASARPYRQWTGKFGQAYTSGLRRCRPRPGDKWHLDEVFIKICGKNHYLSRAVDNAPASDDELTTRDQLHCPPRVH
jgi:hypothetical protein